MALDYSADYYLTKIANGANAPGHVHFLFLNWGNLTWTVLSMDLNFDGAEILNIGKFSDAVEFGGAPVPEPSTLLLFGGGLIGVAFVARRRKSI